MKSNYVFTRIESAEIVRSRSSKKRRKELFQSYKNNFTFIKSLEAKQQVKQTIWEKAVLRLQK